MLSLLSNNNKSEVLFFKVEENLLKFIFFDLEDLFIESKGAICLEFLLSFNEDLEKHHKKIESIVPWIV